MSEYLQRHRFRAFASTLMVMGISSVATPSWADINPWIKASQFNPARWDTAGPKTATPWLHPGTWTPGQDWGWFSGDWQAENILGSWGGLRDDLELRGITFSMAYTGQFAANPIGGQTPDGASWIGSWNFGTFVDFSRLLDMEQRIYFTSSFNLGTGNIGLSPNYVGNHFPVQLSSSGEPGPLTRLVHLAVGAQLFNNTTEVVAGRIITGEDFATLATACTSLNQSICGNPIAGASSINFPTYPIGVWGGRVKVKPGDRWYAQTGAYLVYPSLGDPSEHGIEFGVPDGAGVLAISEIGFNVGNRASESGLPGTYKIGGYYDTERLTNLQTGASERNTWGIYAMGEQMLYSVDDSHSRGLWAWLALSYAPPDLNEITFMAAGGLSYVGLFDSRPDDSLSLIAATGVFSEYLAGQNAETVLEINYRAQINPALYVQPDVQFIFNPDGKSTIDDAVVVGFSVGASF